MKYDSIEIRERFKRDLVSKEPEKIVAIWLLERIPFIFQDNQELFIEWRINLATKLQVDISSILFVGSSCVGISLNPYKNYKFFDNSSDIDVAIVSDYYFNESWRCLRNLGSRIHSLRPREKQSINDHVNKYIYWGIIAADHLLPLFPFGKKWQESLSEMSLIDPTQGREIKIRLYKDFESLRNYHINGLKDLRYGLLNQGDQDV